MSTERLVPQAMSAADSGQFEDDTTVVGLISRGSGEW